VRILAIESSCDETAAAVVEDGETVLSSVVASQMVTHGKYGGVVPELASREHLRAIVLVVREALEVAGTRLGELAAIAATAGPGLVGSLLVGLTYAKSLSFASGVPLIAVNHIEGHIHAVIMEARRAGTPVEYPALALVVSGGHTHLFEVSAGFDYRLLGKTRDDAAGEAFDKVAKLLGFGYPGGPWIDALARYGNPRAVPFAFSQIKTKVHLGGKPPRTKAAKTAPIADLDPRFLFSFSGIKTAVLRYVELHGLRDDAHARAKLLFAPGAEARPPQSKEEALALCPQQILDLAASFQCAVVGDLMKKTFAAAESLGARRILVTGGVAANRELRERFSAEASRRGLRVAFPTLALSTDNAAMIAAAAWPRFLAGDFAEDSLSADPSLALGR